jgi:hypothetical protein
MRRGILFRTIALVALLLPGLVLAAPTGGACGQCDRGVPCATMAAPEPVAEAQSCCSGEPVEPQEENAPAPHSAEACDCGRDAPVATAAVEAPAPEKTGAEALNEELWFANGSHLTPAVSFRRAPAPPPHPLIFLIDCVFLT